jgi:hypothetical protein
MPPAFSMTSIRNSGIGSQINQIKRWEAHK